MDGPPGIDLHAPVGITDRGVLWRASRHTDHDRILRIVAPQFCTGRFRQAIAALRRSRPIRMLEIVEEGWWDGYYHVEYAVPLPWQTLEERMRDTPGWRDRIGVLKSICGVVPHWQSGPVHPLGLNLRNVVLLRETGHWFPWLVGCPPTTIATPCDVFDLDSSVLAALAPELVRGVPRDDRALDAYALGTLAAQAIGCHPTSSTPVNAESRVEVQARGAMLELTLAGSRVPPFLHTTPQLDQLVRTVQRYRHTEPEARPASATALVEAISVVDNPIELANTLLGAPHHDLEGALTILEGADDAPELRLASAIRAADICARRNDPRREAQFLDLALAVDAGRRDLRLRRFRARWTLLSAQRHEETRQHEVDALLADVALLGESRRDPQPHRLAAEVHRWHGDHDAAAREYYQVINKDYRDLDTLHAYWLYWRDKPGAEDDADQTQALAFHRISKLRANDFLTEEEANRWRERFTSPTPPPRR
ncbi:MAG: hypothetical protein AB7L91_18280 [Dehalococcoidia bacterium]